MRCNFWTKLNLTKHNHFQPRKNFNLARSGISQIIFKLHEKVATHAKIMSQRTCSWQIASKKMTQTLWLRVTNVICNSDHEITNSNSHMRMWKSIHIANQSGYTHIQPKLLNRFELIQNRCNLLIGQSAFRFEDRSR